MNKVVIIGAGASGVIASIFASKNKEVIIKITSLYII